MIDANKFDNLKIIVDVNTGCHIIKKQKGVSFKKDGYAIMLFAGKYQHIHRIAYEFYNGKIPDNKVVCHKCDNTICVNPSHLFIGTRKDNQEDMRIKGRASDWSDRPIKKNGMKDRQKLSDKQIREIKSSKKSSYQLSSEYGVSSVQIRRIKNGSRCSSI